LKLKAVFQQSQTFWTAELWNLSPHAVARRIGHLLLVQFMDSSGSTLTKSRRPLSYLRHDLHRDKEGLKA
jgi:hypothetical protein